MGLLEQIFMLECSKNIFFPHMFYIVTAVSMYHYSQTNHLVSVPLKNINIKII